jgi:hypothetical protein
MKTKHGLFFGFVVIALAAMFTLTGCDNPSGGDSNPFVGTWTGGGYTMIIADSTWEIGGMVKGTYTHDGNAAVLTPTHYGNGTTWTVIPAGQSEPSTVTVSGNTLTGTGPDGQPMTLTKS